MSNNYIVYCGFDVVRYSAIIPTMLRCCNEVFTLIYNHTAIAAGYGCRHYHNRNIAAASRDTDRNCDFGTSLFSFPLFSCEKRIQEVYDE